MRSLLWANLGAVYVVWGSTYLAIRVMVETVPPLLGAGLRFLAAALLLVVGIAVWSGVARLRLTAREWSAACVTAVLILVGGIGLLTVAEQEAASGFAALLIASVPLWVVMLRLATGEHVPRATMAGVAIGAVGVALVISGSPLEAPPWAVATLLLAAVLTAAGTFVSPRLPLPADPLVATAAEMLCAGVVLTGAAALAGEIGDVERVSGESAAAFAYLVVFGSVVAYGAFVWLRGNVSPSLVSTYAFVNPVVALLLGAAVLGEDVTAQLLAGAALVVAAVVATQREQR